VVELPFPDRNLNPNARIHRLVKAEATRAARDLAKFTTKQKYDPAVFDGFLICKRYFHPPDRRHRDIDNMGAMCKAYQDGIFDALELDDKMVIATYNIRLEPKGEGSVTIVVAPGKDDR
jgi:crossover junction endodeoxyribonuclease RusA